MLIIIAAAASSPSSNSGKTGTTSSPALVTGHHHGKRKGHGRAQTFRGNGSQNIGTINVPTQSTLHWSCRSCGHLNFVIDNSPSDGMLINVNALGPTRGQTVVDAGTYHDVAINTEGQAWTIKISPGT